MKKIKKLLFLVSLFLLSISVVGATPRYDNKDLTEETAEFVFSLNSDKTEVKPGDQVAITYRLEKMTEYGLRSISYELVYDHTKMVPIMVMNEDGELEISHEFGRVGKDDKMVPPPLVGASNEDPTKNRVRSAGATGSPTHNTGDVITIYFQVLSSAPEGKIDVYVGNGVATAGAKEDGLTDPKTTFYIKSNVEDLKVVNNPNPPAKKEIGTTQIANINDQVYTGSAIKPNTIIADGLRGLTPGQDYLLSYENNTEIGTATIKVTGIGDYTGTTTKTFKIVEKLPELSKDIKDAKITIANKFYTGKVLTTNISVELNDKTLVYGTDYKVTYKNNKKPGTASVTITGIGDYTGTITKTFDIVVPNTKQIITSAQTTNSISVKWAKNTTLSGYELYYSTSANGKYTKITTISKNSTVTYKKTGLKAGVTYYFKIRGYVTISGKKYYSDYSTALASTTIPTAPKIKQSGVNAISTKTSWNKVTGATGYELYRATSKNGKYTKINVKDAVLYTDTGVKSATTYYYKVRAYKELDGKYLYSAYSNVISITTNPTNPVLKTSATSDATVVKWAKVSGASGYEVYFATSAKGKYKKVYTGTSTSYKKTKLAPGKIYYYKVRTYKKVSGKKIYSGYTTTYVATTPATPTVKVIAKNNVATLKWTQTSGATGYEVWYSSTKNGEYILGQDIEKSNETTTNITDFETSGTYYFKVRAYKKVGTIKVYGKESNIVAAKITVPVKEETKED